VIRRLTVIALLIYPTVGQSQNNLQWNSSYRISLTDFQSPATKVGTGVGQYSLHPTCGFNFAFHMSNFEFMATKDFNSKVNSTFVRNASSITAPNDSIANDLVAFAQFYFDLCELYARKFRQQLHENKSAFSKSDFYLPVYDSLQQSLQLRINLAGNETDLGRKRDRLMALHISVLSEIDDLRDYCKECTPPKKRKK
jgi:hypothetical protein